jgi:integrase
MARRNLNKPLTQRQIDTLPPPKTGRLELRDSGSPGLVLRVVTSGARSWCFEYRSPRYGKNARLTFDSFCSLADARAAALAYRAQVAEGHDPVSDLKEKRAARQVQYASVVTVAEAVNQYEPHFIADGGDKTKSRRDRMATLRRAVEPFLSVDMAALTLAGIVNRLDEIKLRAPVASNRAHAEISAWLRWSKKRGLIADNPIAGLGKEVEETARERVLTDNELAAILTETADGLAFSDLVRVLLHTGMRRNEVATLQPRDLDFEARTIIVRPTVDKTSRTHPIPMPEALVPMLDARVKFIGNRPDAYIFGEGSGFRSPISGFHKPTERLRTAIGADDWTLHDLRRTVDTRLHDAGVDALAIEDLLGHRGGLRGGVKGTYNRSVTFGKQAAALADWAAKLAGLAGANVVPLRRRA